jgi:N6-adenosine-specific RNA methylase IME4
LCPVARDVLFSEGVVTAVLVADPAWLFGDSLPGDARGASKHYACMSIDDLCAMRPLFADEPNSVCFMWRVSAMVEEAYRVVRAWGYVPKSELVWEKTTATGKAHFGMGRYFRMAHESCILAVRGSAFPEVRNVRSRFAAPVGVHSQKPEAFYELVERMYPNAVKGEMFARTVRPGWHQHGLELGKLGVANG